MKATNKIIEVAYQNMNVHLHGCEFFDHTCNNCWAAWIDAMSEVRDEKLLEKMQEFLDNLEVKS